ncbi:MAG TPA: carboxypeptidase-like regulatory domain-containing protein [archaeon]|nr:carboxypeptidase-like regulatory domain-containing protein [archaeon]
MKSLSLPILVLLSLVLTRGLAAQTTGKIEGQVTDKETGNPMEGCQVTVEGTTLGNITNAEGRYFILNLPPGLKTLRFNFTGYRPALVENVRIQAGHTVTVNSSMETMVFELEAIVFEGEAEPLVPRDNVQTKQRIPSDFSSSMPVGRLEDALALKAGVVENEAGKFSIRGGRLGKEAVYIDGILVRAFSEQAYLSDKISADNSPLSVGKNAVEEVNVITGGFNAEYGQAQSGVINIISREGGNEIKGSVQLITDGFMPRTSDYGYNELSCDLGVPLGLPSFSSLFLSAEIKGTADATPAVGGEHGGFLGINEVFLDRLNSYLDQLGLYDPNSAASRKVGLLDANSFQEDVQRLDRYSFANVFWNDTNGDGLPDQRLIISGDRFTGGTRELDPAGVYFASNPARNPGNSGDLYSLSGKLTWYTGPSLKFLATFMGSRNQRIYYQHENIFNAPERRNAGDRVRTTNTIFGLDWIIHQSAEKSANLIIRASTYSNKQNGGALSPDSYLRSTVGGFGLSNLSFISESRTSLDDIYQAVRGYEPTLTTYPTYNSGYLNAFASTFTPLPGQRGQDNLANPLLLFNESGLPLRLVNDLEERFTFKADFDAQVDQYNRVKMGAELQRMKIYTRHFFYVGGPLQDAWTVEPKIYASYAQNRLDLGDLVLDTGLRLEYFDPAADFPSVPGETLPEDSRYKARKKLKFSPRVEVGFPVTDRSQLRLSYGVFAQVPAFSDYYSLLNRDIQQDLASDNINNYFGNGRLDMPYTTAFEAGFTTLLSENVYLDFVGYNKDTRGDIAYRWLTPQELLDLGGQGTRQSTRFGKNLFMATNGDQGNIKGFDLSFSRRMAGYWSASANYSLTFARSSASDPQEFARAYGRQIIRDPLTGQDKNPDPPSNQSPTDNDQTHTVNLQLSVELPPDFKEGSLAGKLLSGTSAFFTWHFHSGRPYTVSDRLGNLATGENNNARTHSVKLADLRVSRRFPLGKKRRLSCFVEIMNLLNTVNIKPSRVNPTTGEPGVDRFLLGELSKQLTSFTSIPESRTVEQEAEYNTELAEDPLERLQLAQIRDINGNGLVEYPEAFALRLAALLAAMDNPMAYLRPREVRLGFRFDF